MSARTPTAAGFAGARSRPPADRRRNSATRSTRHILENVPEGPDAERAIERLARSGCKLIFTTSFGFMDATVKVAAKFPNVKFEHGTGYKSGPESRDLQLAFL